MAQYYIVKDNKNVIQMTMPVTGSYIEELQQLGTVIIADLAEFPQVRGAIHLGGSVDDNGVYSALTVSPPPPSPNMVSDGSRWVEQLTDEQAAESFNVTRNSALLNSDWTQLQNCPLSPAEVNEAADWRQTLRDITNGVTDPHDQLRILRTYINSRPSFITIV